MIMKVGQPNILAVLARVYVDSLEATLPLYRELVGGYEPHVFEFRQARLAMIGSFLLVEGANEEMRSRAATIVVRDIRAIADAVFAAGGELIEGPAAGPNGPRLIARHPDGNVLEYIQLKINN